MFGLPLLAAAALLFAVLAHWLKPAPPKRLAIATGAADGAYYRYAQRYRERLARDGIALEIVNTRGSIDNLARLRDAHQPVQAAFVQGGLGYLSLNPQQPPRDEVPLQSLATVTYEPVWLFTRRDDIDGLPPLRGLRVAVGPEGSGVRKVALDLLHDAGIPDGAVRALDAGGMAAAEQLLRGEADAVFLVSAAEAPPVQRLLREPGVRLASIAQSAAISRRMPYLQPILFPQGVVDLQANIPPRDVTLLATTANLVIREDLHPALAYLLLEAAVEVHGAPGLLQRPGEFPSPKATDFPLADESRRYFTSGRPFLQRYLPFWLANLAERLLLILLPILAVLIPLLRAVPDWWRHRMDRKLYRWYGELLHIERDIFKQEVHPADVPRHVAKLNQMERDVDAMGLPLDYSDKLYTLRQHIDFVRARLNHVRVDGPGPLSQP